MVLPLFTPANSNGTTSPSNSATMPCSGRTQRTAPAVPQRIDFGQGSLAMASGTISAITSAVSRPLRAIDRDIEFALGVGLFLALLQRHAGRAQKAFQRLFRRARARALAFLGHVRLLGRQPVNGQRQPPRPGKALDAFEHQAAIGQRADDQPFEILRRVRLHARGDFLGEQFEQKISHHAYLGV